MKMEYWSDGVVGTLFRYSSTPLLQSGFMRIIEHISEMQDWSEGERCQGRRIVMVPTMGFLHQGHLSLVRDGKKRGDRLVVSIYVNPKQFGPSEDFVSYPRDFDRDRNLLELEGADVLFSPTNEEMYPAGHQTYVEVENLSTPLCGESRPGHFRGVATVVAKLFNIERPHAAVFGCKDYQQLQIVRRMVKDLNLGVEIVGHPIVRHPDGLAMSSRNAYLSMAEREAALCLSRALRQAETMLKEGETSSAVILERVKREIAREPLARLEYAHLTDTENLLDLDHVGDGSLLALAVRIGKTRLIDNVILRP
ncbi:MAG TPA: pantoate--beta-alanine ligase [Candidatus Acidoferrales bacterium]|nr:pantoate--beta-alanine ligase [Candidatus Acidoferrales bacterium]